MPNTRTYSIAINGVNESINAVDSLLKKLNELEQRINTLSGKTVSVGASTSGAKGGGGGNASALSAEEKVQKKIESTVERIAEARTKEYQTLQQAKADLKEIEKTQKSVAAAQRISGDEAKQYANTLDGQRQKLADMKIALGSKELGSADFEKQVKDINELNTKILNIEKSYGQFGRNVGRYSDGVVEGLQKIKVNVNGTEREFTTLKEAVRTLKNEMGTMDEGTEEFNNLREVVAQLDSKMKDLMVSSKGMDELLDTMEGFVSLASVAQGLSSLFGIDDSEIQRSIQKLVALQNVIQGIERIRQQMDKNEGIGKLINRMGISADKAAAKMLNLKYGVDGIEASSKKAAVAANRLSGALKAIGAGAIILAVSKAIEQVSVNIDRFKNQWHKAFGEAATTEEQLEMRMQSLNVEYEKRNKLIEDLRNKGQITQEEAIARQLDNQNKLLQQQVALLGERNKLSITDVASTTWKNLNSGAGLLGGALDNIDKLVDFKIKADSAKKSTEELAKSIKTVGEETKTAGAIVQSDATEYVARWLNEVNKFTDGTEASNKKLKEFKKELNDKNSVINSVIMNIHKFFPKEEWAKAIDSAISKVYDLEEAMNGVNVNFLDKIHMAMDKNYGTAKDLEEAYKELGRLQNADLSDSTKAINVAEVTKYIEWLQSGGDKAKETVKKTGGAVKSTVKNVEEDINRLRIRLMQEGLRKTLAEIDAEAQREIDALKLSGARREEALKLIDDYYNQRRIEAKRKNNEEIIKIQRELNNQLLRMEAENAQQQQAITNSASENFLTATKQNITLPRGAKDNPLYKLYFTDEHPNRALEFTINFDFAATGDERILELLSEDNRTAQLMYWDKQNREGKISDAEFGQLKERLEAVTESEVREAVNKINSLMAEYGASTADATIGEEAIAALATEYTKKIDDVMRSIGMTINSVRDFQYDSLESLYEDALEEMRQTYYKGILDAEQKTSDETYNIRKDTLWKIAKLEREEASEQQRDRIGNFNIANPPADDVLRRFLAGNLTDADSGFTFGSVGEDFKKLAADAKEGSEEFEGVLDDFKSSLEQFWNEYQKIQQNINAREKQNMLGLDIEKAQRDSQNISDYYAKMVNDIERVVSSTQQKYSSLPDTDALGIVNVDATKKKINETINAYKYLQSRLIVFLQDIRDKFSNGEITTDAFESLSDRITAQLRKVSEAIKLAKTDSQNLLSDFIKSLMPYMQEVINGISGILGELSNLYSAQSENRLKLLEKENERLQELYDKQEEIEQRHRDNLNTIEDEISNARGARREFLVDSYNAEIDAERRAVAEKKRLQEELKRNQHRQEQEEKELRKKQNKIQFSQATASAAMAVLNAYSTSPWAVGQILGPIALALTSAQLVIMKKAMAEAERYETGGLLRGKSHRNGGIKTTVGGRPVELEGNEYVIRKKSTLPNLGVLDFVNRSERKLNLSDFIDFYSSKSAKKQIKSNLKSTYADGGVLKAPNSGKRNRVVIVKDESHPIVSVVDILDATKSYQNVQVLAGEEI